MSTTLRLLGIFGTVLFATLLLLTFVSPATFEESAKGFVKSQIEKEVLAKQQAINDSSITATALNIAGKLGLEREKILSNLQNDLPGKIASIIASMCGYDCEKQKAVARSIASGYMERIKSIQVAESTLSDIVKGKYLKIVGALKLDLRIFFSSNSAVFLILLSISLLKPRAVQHLFLPGLLLVFATVASSAIYVFGQDWFYAILYNDYMGFSYLLYLTIIFGLLIDITFNKARATTEIINGIANMLGLAFSVVPC